MGNSIRRQNPQNLQRLNGRCILKILKLIDPIEACKCIQVCKSWKVLIKSKEIWIMYSNIYLHPQKGILNRIKMRIYNNDTSEKPKLNWFGRKLLISKRDIEKIPLSADQFGTKWHIILMDITIYLLETRLIIDENIESYIEDYKINVMNVIIDRINLIIDLLNQRQFRQAETQIIQLDNLFGTIIQH